LYPLRKAFVVGVLWGAEGKGAHGWSGGRYVLAVTIRELFEQPLLVWIEDGAGKPCRCSRLEAIQQPACVTLRTVMAQQRPVLASGPQAASHHNAWPWHDATRGRGALSPPEAPLSSLALHRVSSESVLSWMA
jgi:hypothetical protein